MSWIDGNLALFAFPVIMVVAGLSFYAMDRLLDRFSSERP
jgi:hypothetical protein